MDIFDAVIAWLEQEKAKGVDGVYLAPESKATLDHFIKLSYDPAALAEYAASVESETEEVIAQKVGVDDRSGRLAQSISSDQPCRSDEITVEEDVVQVQEPVVPDLQPQESAEPTPQVVEPVVENEPNSASIPVTRPPLIASEQFQILQSGSQRADLMFLGEEMYKAGSAQPFADSYELLTKMVTAMRFDMAEVAVASVAKKSVEIDCVEAVKAALESVVATVRPKVIVIMGALPSKTLLGTDDLILNIHGKWLRYGDVMCMPTFHPFYLSRVVERKKQAWADLQQVMTYLGK